MTEATTIDEEIVKIEAALDSFEQKNAGLPALSFVEAPKCLTMSVEDLRHKTPEDLSEFTFEINRYALYIQRVVNKNKAIERWLKAKLDECTAFFLQDASKEYGFNERILMFRNNPPVCKRLNKLLRQKSMEIDRLYDVPNNLKIMADTIRDMKFAAIRKEKNYAKEE